MVIMARVPMGKVLLRNVIRHTDAHNKIQEESEMWKMRDMEKQPSCHRQMPTVHINRGHMHCDRLEGESRDGFGSQKHSLRQDEREREARYWTSKLYDFEANDPDRWGHSGFKELYPEEFQIEGEHGDGGKNKHRKKKKSKDSTETSKTKRSKKSSKKKKKKKEGRKRKRAGGASEEESDSLRGKHRRKRSKSQHGRKKRGRSRGKEDESSSEDSVEEGGAGERKRQRDAHRGADSRLEPLKKRRKNWKGANEESEGSSDD